MRYILLVLCLVAGATLAGPVPPAPLKPARKPVDPGYESTQFLGRVEALSTERITVKPEGYLREDVTWRTPEGVREERYYEQDNNQLPKTFMFTDKLLTIHGVRLPPNRVWVGRRNRGEHAIADLRIGDRVHVSYQAARGENWCSAIIIMRRPGGRVPDAYEDDDKSYKYKTSTERNAAQFIEETVAGQWVPRLRAALKK
ncbi:hypothetical protein VT84_04510 [Gemmata sp. SH-PL17]|uniref:hypothetical protein n=1 Tax=Gemmata sp. SH-PL17 TaxID=1630693 RepID=UPI00078E72AC|nr:hypothetical protein [Gemmata sp. SH-PL17]AMV23650.1 hypothetical protein VT84_04510 [Gemmata sp. SH-PL17]